MCRIATMNSAKLIQSIIAFAAAVWLFSIGLVVGTRSARSRYEKPPVINNTPFSQATGPYVPASPTPSTPYNNNSNTTLPSPPAQQSNPVSEPAQQTPTQNSSDTPIPAAPTDWQEIVNLYVNAVNKTKDTPNFTLTRQDTLNLKLDNITGGSLVTKFANQFVAAQSPYTTETLVFQNGVDINGSGETPLQALPPITGYAALDPRSLLSASAVPNAYGGYTISLALVDELQTLAAPAPNHSTTMEVIDVSALGFPSGTNIERLDITYSGATIVAETDAEGRLAVMTHFLPVSYAEGAGSYSVVHITAYLHGDFTCVYTVTY